MPKRVFATCPDCQVEHSYDEGEFRVVTIRGTGSKQSVKFDPNDHRWGATVRARDGGSCRKCGRTSASVQIEAAHIFRRGKGMSLRPGFDRHTGAGCCLRHDVRNGLALCEWPCHRDWAHGHEDEFLEWAKSLVGEELFAEMELESRGSSKIVPRRTV